MKKQACQSVHYAFVTVSDLEYDKKSKGKNRGLLLFPDNAIIAFPTGANLTAFDEASKTADNEITSAQYDYLLYQGCVFFPTAGYYTPGVWHSANEGGYYWSATIVSEDDTKAYALALEYSSGYSYYPENRSDDTTGVYFPVRLIRVE